MSTRTAMTTENRDQREANAEPNSAGNSGGGAVLGATPCSLCEGMGELDGFGGGGRTDCHKCDGTGKENVNMEAPNA